MARLIQQYNIFKSAILRWITYVILAVGPAFLLAAKTMTKQIRNDMDYFEWIVFIVGVIILPTASVTRAFIDKTLSKIGESNK